MPMILTPPPRLSRAAPPLPRRSFWLGLWRLADPKISLASICSFFLGTCLAAADGPISWPGLALTLGALLLIEFAKNASGEVIDFDSGADLAVRPEDRSPFSGGKRVIIDGLLTRWQTGSLAAVGYGLAIGLGLYIATIEPRVLWLGVIGLGLAFGYHAPPLRLAYRGLGELAVMLAYGPLIGGGTYLVQRGDLTPRVLAFFVPLGIAVAGFLWINEIPDRSADASAGKRTLVVRLGRGLAGLAFPLIMAASGLALAALPSLGFPPGVLLGSAYLVPAAAASARALNNPESTRELIPAQLFTLEAFVLQAIGMGLGLFLRL